LSVHDKKCSYDVASHRTIQFISEEGSQIVNLLLTSGEGALIIDLHVDGPDSGYKKAVDGFVPLGFPIRVEPVPVVEKTKNRGKGSRSGTFMYDTYVFEVFLLYTTIRILALC